MVGQPLPIAALTRLLDAPDDAAGSWIRADPIDLVTDLAAVWLDPKLRFEHGTWLDPITELMRDEGLDFELHASGRGYLRLPQSPDCRFTPPWQLAGQSLEHCLPQGMDQRRWRHLLNETQILLHQHRQDLDDPRSVPGSLWFWGAGALPARDAFKAKVVILRAQDPALLGLAHWLELDATSGPSLAAPGPGELIEWQADEQHSAEANLERLQADLRPAWWRLRRGRINELIIAGRQSWWSCRPRHAWRIWR